MFASAVFKVCVIINNNINVGMKVFERNRKHLKNLKHQNIMSHIISMRMHFIENNIYENAPDSYPTDVAWCTGT
jgi:hypothetical protein